MNSLFVLRTATFGPPATGPTEMILTIIIGCPAPGCWRRKAVSCGLQVIGVGAASVLFFMRDIGVRWLVSTEGDSKAYSSFVRPTQPASETTTTFSKPHPAPKHQKTTIQTATD